MFNLLKGIKFYRMPLTRNKEIASGFMIIFGTIAMRTIGSYFKAILFS